MCDDILENPYVLKRGTILYSGNSGKRQPLTLNDIFGYIGQRGNIKIKGEFVLYASTDYETAKGYALSCLTGGFIHKFKVEKDVVLWEQSDFSDAEEVANCVCPKARGIVVLYSSKDEQKDEFALCSAEDYLNYVSTQNCTSGEWYHIIDRITAQDIVTESIPV